MNKVISHIVKWFKLRSLKIKENIMNLYKRLNQFIVKKPMNYFSYFFAHGLFHCILLIFLIWLFFIWEKKATTSQIPIYHHVNLQLMPKNWKDSIEYFFITININSDTLKKNKGYTSSMDVMYRLQDFRDTALIDFTRFPYKSIVEIDTVGGIGSYIVSYNKDSLTRLEIPTYGKFALPSGGHVPGSQILSFMTNDLVSGEDNPYYYFDFGIDVNNVDKEEMTYNGSGLFIQVGDYVRFGNDVRETRSLRYQYIYPEPSYFHSGVIAYIGDDLRKVLANRKIIFQAEDVQLKNKDEREGFVSSVLLGSLLGFILTVIVEIFSKWKRVNDNERKRHST